jgi:hypothetical protein
LDDNGSSSIIGLKTECFFAMPGLMLYVVGLNQSLAGSALEQYFFSA